MGPFGSVGPHQGLFPGHHPAGGGQEPGLPQPPGVSGHHGHQHQHYHHQQHTNHNTNSNSHTRRTGRAINLFDPSVIFNLYQPMSALATALYSLGFRLYHFFLDVSLAAIPKLTFLAATSKEPQDHNDEGLSANQALSLLYDRENAPRISSSIVQGLGLLLLIVLFFLILKKFWIDPIFRDFEEAENEFFRKRGGREPRRSEAAKRAGSGHSPPLPANRHAALGSTYFGGKAATFKRFPSTIVNSHKKNDHSVTSNEARASGSGASEGAQKLPNANSGPAARWVNQCLVNVLGGLEEARDGFLTKWMTAMNDHARVLADTEKNEVRIQQLNMDKC